MGNAVAKHDLTLNHHINIDTHINTTVQAATNIQSRRIGHAHPIAQQLLCLSKLALTFYLI